MTEQQLEIVMLQKLITDCDSKIKFFSEQLVESENNKKKYQAMLTLLDKNGK